MLKASNNHFGEGSKLKITKNKALCNLKNAKIAKK